MKLLLAEDERSLSKALTRILKHSHYSVDAVYDGEDALYYLQNGEYDAAVLDVMMPKKDGFAVIKAVREAGNTVPVIMLTARAELEDKVRGLDLGADDYLTKPFEPEELLARLRVMTRKDRGSEGRILRTGNVTLDRKTFRLSSPSGEQSLANKEFQMMELLMTDPGRILSADTFLDKVWGYDSDADINVVWVYISYLRKKLKVLNADVSIRAKRNAGYYLEQDRDQ